MVGLMGYAFAVAKCYMCEKGVTFNPDLVPVFIHDSKREPLCRECVEQANRVRRANGVSPIEVMPGAYEPLRAEEL